MVRNSLSKTRWWWFPPLVCLPVIATSIMVWFVWIIPDINWSKQHQLCDKEVAVLLHSTDLVEVIRAGFIVLRLECSIDRRL